MAHSARLGAALLRMAVVYLVAGLALGMYMAISQDHTLATVHSHVGLLGWTAMAIAGLVYVAVPACAANRLARWHFWLHTIGLPIMIGGLWALLATGNARIEPVVAAGSTLVTVSLVLFAANVLRHAGTAASSGPHQA